MNDVYEEAGSSGSQNCDVVWSSWRVALLAAWPCFSPQPLGEVCGLLSLLATSSHFSTWSSKSSPNLRAPALELSGLWVRDFQQEGKTLSVCILFTEDFKKTILPLWLDEYGEKPQQKHRRRRRLARPRPRGTEAEGDRRVGRFRLVVERILPV